MDMKVLNSHLGKRKNMVTLDDLIEEAVSLSVKMTLLKLIWIIFRIGII